ncbi:MAG: HlyD family efflux transporter periplasmic adaptor subunit [Rhizobiaceae bacterium]|nr:HlyD family efflux transporter periplasmic adaptor subunit [Rhizobiaceae bacterium]
MRGGVSYSGAPVWIVLDPIRNRFFRITYEMFQLLSLWNRAGSVARLIVLVAQTYGRASSPDEVNAATRLLDNGFLFETPVSGSWRTLHAASRPRHSLFMRVVHNYLFFKIPLVRPSGFLKKTWPFVKPLFSRTFLVLTLLAGLLGLYLVSRQWEAFKGTFPYVFTLEGAVISLLSVAFIKSLHELGHAYVAHRYGCRVPTMGFAMMVLMPLLYTDVSDAWRLKERRKRLAIDSAGMLVEFAVAAYALLAWSFLPEGPLRSAVFVLAAVGWVLSLLVNTNPFMRFDGYYILADAVGIENLQPRAFRHLRWRIKELLFGLGSEPPEYFPRRVDLFLTAYAIATAVYRLVLYLGIALLVYHFFIKLVGILLFAVEIGFFIIRPVWAELKEWFAMRHEILASPRAYVSLALLALGTALFFIPVSGRVAAPAILQPQAFARLYPQESGEIVSVNVARGQDVREGDILFEIRSPTTSHERRLTDIEIALAEVRLSRMGAEANDLAQSGTLQSQLASLRAQRSGLEEREKKMTVYAPFDGRMADIKSGISKGRWVGRSQQLGYLEATGVLAVRGYIEGEDRPRVEAGAKAVFVPDDLSRAKIPAKLEHVSAYGVSSLDLPDLASINGGPIAVYEHANHRLTPATAHYAVRAAAEEHADPIMQTVRGTLLIDARPESLASRVWRWVGRVLVRELGF